MRRSQLAAALAAKELIRPLLAVERSEVEPGVNGEPLSVGRTGSGQRSPAGSQSTTVLSVEWRASGPAAPKVAAG